MNHHRQEKEEIINQQKIRVKKLQEKSDLIDNIVNKTFCKLDVSKISGIGVFAIRDIPADTVLFEKCNLDEGFPIELSKEELSKADDLILEQIRNLFVSTPFDTYPLSRNGLNAVDISFYLNHSETPNVKFCLERGEPGKFLVFVSRREIERGEELTQDYNNLSPYKEKLYEQFFFLHDKK
tara:strand:- start:1191 stop:1733 length:543 start_codon:yes stop_codon:yes gene_type:complete